MKQIFTIFCLAIVVLLAQQGAFAQPTDGITFRQNWYNYVAPNPAWEDWNDVYEKVDGRGFEIGYNRNLSKHTWLYVPAKIGVAQCLGFIHFLESAGALPLAMRELVVERAVAARAAPLPLNDLKMIVQMVYRSLGHQPGALIVDELSSDHRERVCH